MVEGWQRIGLIINPLAGSGLEQALCAAGSAVSSLGAKVVLTGPGKMGRAALSGWPGRILVYEVEATAGRNQTCTLAQRIAQQDLDALVVVGGDGTLADVAQVLIEKQCRTPIIGIGAGSTNVGRLITCPVGGVAQLERTKLETWSVDCLAAFVNGHLLGRAFNDVVIGYTVVATIAGQIRDVDAAERSRGKLVHGTPRTIATSDIRVTRSTADGEIVVAQGESVATVVAGFAEPAFFGKAVCGGICLAALTRLPAGCLVSSLPLVQVEIGASDLTHAPPIVSSYVSLSEQASIMVEKVRDGAVLCVDGNPLRQLARSDRLVISVIRDVVRGVRFVNDQRSE